MRKEGEGGERREVRKCGGMVGEGGGEEKGEEGREGGEDRIREGGKKLDTRQ